MIPLGDILRKKVVEAGGRELGVADGMRITISDYQGYLRVRGDPMLDCRGHIEEYIPLNEVDRIDDKVHLLKTKKELCEIIKDFDIESMETHNASNLLGMRVVDSLNKEIGNLTDIIIMPDEWKLYYIIKGPEVEKIRGHKKELLPLFEIDKITSSIKIDLTYEDLAKKIIEIKTNPNQP
jgi:sporulation protein YlmC with PRC-barrel domain